MVEPRSMARSRWPVYLVLLPRFHWLMYLVLLPCAAKLTFVLDRKVDNFVASSKEITNNEGEDNDGGASTCVICRSGSAADTQHLASIVRNEMVSRQLLYRIRGTVTHATSLLRNMLVDNEDLSASLICAGYDHELKRGVIYSITPGGTVFEEQTWAAGGSGSTYILGYLDSVHPKDHDSEPSMLQTEEEALEFVSNAIGLAMELDGSSGGFIRMYVVDKHGKKFVTQMPKHNSNGGNGYKSGESRNSIQSTDNNRLENFAPAMTPIKAASSLSSRK